MAKKVPVQMQDSDGDGFSDGDEAASEKSIIFQKKSSGFPPVLFPKKGDIMKPYKKSPYLLLVTILHLFAQGLSYAEPDYACLVENSKTYCDPYACAQIVGFYETEEEAMLAAAPARRAIKSLPAYCGFVGSIFGLYSNHDGDFYEWYVFGLGVPSADTDQDGDGIPDWDDINSADTSKIHLGASPIDCKDNVNQNRVGDPINLFNGNLFESREDFSFKSPFIGGFKFERAYNSRGDSSSAIGNNWTHNYSIQLNRNYNDSSLLTEIVDQSGRGIYFQRNTQNNISQGALSESSTILYDIGDYIWARDDGSTLTFNNTKKLISITDKNNNIQTLTYNSVSGLLETVTDEASGKVLTFSYNSDNRIESISGPVTTAVPDGIWVSYQYDDNGNLTKVIYADDGNGSTASGFEYRYEDVNDPNNLTAKYDLEGHLLSSWTYDDSDRAISTTNSGGTGVKNIDYTDPAAVVVTTAYDVAQTYQIQEIAGRKKIMEKSNSQSCSTCSDGIKTTEFDPDTGYPTRREYFNGRIDLFQDYDDKGNPGTHVISSGSSQEKTIEKTWHPVLAVPLTLTQKSLLADDANPDRSRIITRDYDDPSANGDSDTPNEAPTNLIHRLILRGFTTDASGAVIPLEQTTAYTYNAKGQILSVNGPLAGDQDIVAFAYDNTTGDLISVTRPLAGTVTFTRDAAGNILTTTDENQVVTTFTYDGRNRQTSVTADGASATSTYTAAGSPASLTDRAGRTQTLSYGSRGLLQRLTDPAGSYFQYTYDQNGNPTETSIYSVEGIQQLFSGLDFGDPSSDTTLSPGKPAKALSKGQGNSTTLETLFAYEYGNLTQITDPAGTVTTLAYDTLDRLSSRTEQQTDTITADTRYAYDLDGNLVQVTDAQGRITELIFDDAGRKVTQISPDTGTTRYVYDTAGNLIQKIISDGTTTRFTYDVLGRLTATLYSDENQDVLFFYDQGINGRGRLTGISQDAETYAFSYDAAGNLTRAERTTDQATFTTTYEYDPSGSLTAMVYPDGRSVVYELDASGNISRVTTAKDGTSRVLAEDAAYKPFGPLSGMSLGSGLQITNTFDLNYRPVNLNAGDILDRSFTYDAAGQITDITDLLDSSQSQSFGYDLAGRLLSAQGAYGNLAFTYDKTGNRLTRTLGGDNPEIIIYGYAPDSNLLTSISGTNTQTDLTYDTNGRPMTRGDLSFTYNDAGRIAGVTNSQSTLARYLYNALGQRTRKTSGGKTTLYHYDLWGNLIGESTESGDFFMDYVYLAGTRLAGMPSDPDDVFSVSVAGSRSGPLEGVRVYAFNASGTYSGVYAATDASGIAVFQKSVLTGTAYTFRADYLNEKFWSDLTQVASNETSIVIQETGQTVSVIQGGQAVEGVKVYVFDESDRYLGLSGVTDGQGQVAFSLPEGQAYKFRADVLGQKFFSDTVTASEGATATIDTQGGTLTFFLTQGGLPQTGIKTYVFSSAGVYLGKSAVTDDNGVALFDLPSGTYKIRCDYLGYKFWSDEIALSESQSAALDIPHKEVTLSAVKAFGSEETPAAGIKTYLFSEAGTYLGLSETTDDDGRAAYLLPEQAFKIRGDYLGGKYWSDSFTWTDPVITISQGQITLIVTGTDQPLAGVTVYAFSVSGTYLGISAVTDDQGRAAFVLPQGSYTFRADYLGSKYWSQSLTVTAGEAAEAEVSTGGGTVTATVQKDDGTPLDGIKAYLFTASGTYLGLSSTTDAEGGVTFSASGGEYKIRLDYLGYQFWSEPFTLTGDTEFSVPISHTLVTGGVSAVNADQARALEGIKVYLFSEAGTYMGLNAVTNEDGEVSLSLPERAYKLRADYLGGKYWSESFTGSDTTVTIPEGRAAVTVGTDENPISGITVYVFSSDTYTGLSAVTDDQGAAGFDLPEGTWRFRADYMGSRYWGTGAVLAGQDNAIEIDPGSTSLALTLEKATDEPLEGVKVYAFSASGTYLGLSQTTSGTGLATFDLPQGAYTFRADYLGYKFWTGTLTLPEVSSETLTIPHRDVTLTVQGQYEDAFSLSEIKTYLFTEAGTYQGLSITTDVNGQAVYSLPEQAYKLRADHLGVKYWSEPATWEDRTITVDHGAVNVTVTQAGTALAGARVYVFSSSGTYLGRSAATDSAGAATLTLPVNTYKLRIDYNGGKYWTEEIDLIQGQAVDAAYDLDTLALNLTANPHYARYDGEMPQKEDPSVLLASIGSLAGYETTPSQPETVYYINDHLVTPLKVIDADNQVVWDGVYLPFGLVEDSVGGAQNLLRFPGQYFDGETGLHYNWHRYYNPETGRYITPDPIGLTGGINPFVYVSNNPINAFDPMGLIERYQFAGVRWFYHDKISKTDIWEELPKKENYGTEYKRIGGTCYRTSFNGIRVNQFKATWNEQRVIKQTRSMAWDVAGQILNYAGIAGTAYSAGTVAAGEALLIPTAGKEIVSNTGGFLLGGWLDEQGWQTESDTNRMSDYQVEFLGRVAKPGGKWNMEKVSDCLCN